MPRIINVSDVRQAIYRAASAARPDKPNEAVSAALFGRLFHQAFAALCGPDPAVNLVRPLERADRTPEAWQMQLIDHAYLWVVGPQLVSCRVEMECQTGGLIRYWEAVCQLCRWLCRVVWDHSRPAQAIEELRHYIFAGLEVECSCELSDPSWSDSVILQGRLDALLRQPQTGRLCVVELKLGPGSAEADLCQACLYHLILSRSGAAPEETALALCTFQPQPREHVWEAAELSAAREKLMALIGALTGATGPSPARAKTISGRVESADAHWKEMAQRLVSVFDEFGAPILLEGPPMAGPTFYRFLARPAHGVAAPRILRMGTTIWPRLFLDQPPQISMERGLIAIDVERPRSDRHLVRWQRPENWPDRPGAAKSCSFPVGMAVDGSWTWADLAAVEHSHILVAGTNGSGKSEWLRMAIGSLCAASEPVSLQFVLIDPKRTAFPALCDSPFLRRSIVYPSDEDILSVLDDLVAEMERRFGLFEGAQAKSLAEYNERAVVTLPRLVCVCDEYADLVLAGTKQGREIERRVGRLGAKGRAAGVHLILATQRPSRDVVTGVIRSNMNARVALKVNEKLESRIIIDQGGAEQLLGSGDLLFKDLGSPVRLQSPLIQDVELRQAARCP